MNEAGLCEEREQRYRLMMPASYWNWSFGFKHFRKRESEEGTKKCVFCESMCLEGGEKKEEITLTPLYANDVFHLWILSLHLDGLLRFQQGFLFSKLCLSDKKIVSATVD